MMETIKYDTIRFPSRSVHLFFNIVIAISFDTVIVAILQIGNYHGKENGTSWEEYHINWPYMIALSLVVAITIVVNRKKPFLESLETFLLLWLLYTVAYKILLMLFHEYLLKMHSEFIGLVVSVPQILVAFFFLIEPTNIHSMDTTIIITITTVCQIISTLVYDERLLGSTARIVGASIVSFSIDLYNTRIVLVDTLLLSMQIGYLFFTDYRVAYSTFIIHAFLIYYVNIVQRDGVLIKSKHNNTQNLDTVLIQKGDGTTYQVSVDNIYQ